jgi:transposase-like protein
MKKQAEILTLFKSLNICDQDLILEKLKQAHEIQMPVIENAKQEALSKESRKPCPHCKSKNVYSRGSQNNIKTYSCKDCKKWYNQTAGTPLWDIKLKEKWSKYLQCMNAGYSIRKCASEVGICIQTSFDWRHKILSSLNSLVPETLSGVVECDELELAINNKGDRNLSRKPRKRSTDFSRNESQEVNVVQIVTAVERKGDKLLKVVVSKRLSEVELEKALEGKLENGTRLITDKHPTYKSYGKNKKEITHKSVRASEHVDKQEKSVHLQTVNQTHSQLRKFLGGFNGVSTKYLQNYLNWFAYEKKILLSKQVLKQWVLTGLMSPTAYALFWEFKQNVVNIRK